MPFGILHYLHCFLLPTAGKGKELTVMGLFNVLGAVPGTLQMEFNVIDYFKGAFFVVCFLFFFG